MTSNKMSASTHAIIRKWLGVSWNLVWKSGHWSLIHTLSIYFPTFGSTKGRMIKSEVGPWWRHYSRTCEHTRWRHHIVTAVALDTTVTFVSIVAFVIHLAALMSSSPVTTSSPLMSVCIVLGKQHGVWVTSQFQEIDSDSPRNWKRIWLRTRCTTGPETWYQCFQQGVANTSTATVTSRS
jgi:hypothetical protein